jgi:pyridoxine 4-dehydrogenase
LLAAAEDAGVAFSPWHPTTVPNQDGNAAHFGDVLGPICEKHHATVRQIALAWLLHRSPFMLPIPATTSLTHLKEILDAAAIDLTAEEVHAITQLVPEDTGGAEIGLTLGVE